MDQFQAFIDMGGYAAFVWPSYALAAVGIIAVWYMSRRTVKNRQRELDQLRPPRNTGTADPKPAEKGEPEGHEA